MAILGFIGVGNMGGALARAAVKSGTEVLLANRFLGERGKVGHVVLMGSGEPLDNYDAFVETMKSMGVEDAIAIYQAALDRWNAR